MQTLQVLNADAELYTASEQYITIDTDTREITIPESQKLFGVKDDLKAERKYFKCKKVVGDNLDLSKHRLYINYMNANKETSAYLVDDVKVDGDYITFSWLLYRSVTKYIGNVSFIVCAKSSNNKGLLQTDWNTTLATGTVKEGLEVDMSITEEYPDVIEQILNRLDGVEGGQISDEQMQNAIKKYFTANPQKLADMQSDTEHRTVSDAEKQKWNNKSDFNGSYNSLTDKPTIPTELSQLSEDTTHRLVTDAEKAKWNNSFSGSYNDLTNKPTIPSKLSQLTEDDSHVTVTKVQKTKIDTVPTQFKTINNQSITGTGNITIPTSGTGTSITVDSALSNTSTNPVQNKVVTSALKNKADTDDLGIKKYEKSDASITLESGSYVVFPEMESITVTLGAVANNIMYIAGFEFSSGATATSLVLTGCTVTSDSDSVDANSKYEVNILGTSAIIRKR